MVLSEKLNIGRAVRASCPLEVTERDDGCLFFFSFFCGFLCFQDCRVIRRPRRPKEQVLWIGRISSLGVNMQGAEVFCSDLFMLNVITFARYSRQLKVDLHPRQLRTNSHMMN